MLAVNSSSWRCIAAWQEAATAAASWSAVRVKVRVRVRVRVRVSVRVRVRVRVSGRVLVRGRRHEVGHRDAEARGEAADLAVARPAVGAAVEGGAPDRRVVLDRLVRVRVRVLTLTLTPTNPNPDPNPHPT